MSGRSAGASVDAGGLTIPLWRRSRDNGVTPGSNAGSGNAMTTDGERREESAGSGGWKYSDNY